VRCGKKKANEGGKIKKRDFVGETAGSGGRKIVEGWRGRMQGGSDIDFKRNMRGCLERGKRWQG